MLDPDHMEVPATVADVERLWLDLEAMLAGAHGLDPVLRGKAEQALEGVARLLCELSSYADETVH